MTKRTRIFITGYGSVNALDSDVLGTSEALARVASGSAACPVAEINGGEYVEHKITRRMDRFSLMAYVAVRKAIAHAGIQIDQMDQERSGIVMNTCYGPLESTRRYMIKVIRDGARKAPAAIFPNTVHNAFTGLITMELRVHGSNSTVSGQNPLCYGLDMIRQGFDDLMIVGGCDELLPTVQDGFAARGLRADGAGSGASVFERDGSQFRLGEGAAVLILESEASVKRRGVRPLAEVFDYGMANGLATQEGAAFAVDEAAIGAAMEQALQRSGIEVSAIDMVAAASNGIAAVASAEIRALQTMFGRSARPLVGNIKGALGETLGAAAAFSTIEAVEAISRSVVAPIAGLEAGCLPPAYVAGHAQQAVCKHALVNALELGGTFTSLALGAVT